MKASQLTSVSRSTAERDWCRRLFGGTTHGEPELSPSARPLVVPAEGRVLPQVDLDATIRAFTRELFGFDP